MALSYKEVGEIVSLLKASEYDEFVLETAELKLALRRGRADQEPQTPPSSVAQPSAASQGQSQPDRRASANMRTATEPHGAGVVAAPMVGTFYRAPNPDAEPFVELGTRVAVGDPLCVIEVMKLFTTVHAEFAGTVRDIGPNNADLVEYGQMLFVISPD